MAASKIDKPRAEVNYVRKGLMLAMKERKLSAYLVADLLQMHRSNISKFLVSKTQLNDEAIEMLYEKGLVARPTEQDLEKAQAQEPISPDGKDGIEYIPIADLRPHPANQLIYGDCADEDLVDSIRENGVLSPLLVTTGGIMVSGHRRLDAARRAGLDEVPVIRCEKTDELEVEALLIEANKQRQKSVEQVGREYVRLKDIEAEKARRRELAGIPLDSTGGYPPMNSSEGSTSKGDARDIAAQKLGIGSQKAEHAAAVIRKIDELRANGESEKAEEIRSTLNTKSVNAAFEKIRSRAPEQKKQQNRMEGDPLVEENVRLQEEIKRLQKENAALKRPFPVFRPDGRLISGWKISPCQEEAGWRFCRSDGKTGHVPIARGDFGFIASFALADTLEAEFSERNSGLDGSSVEMSEETEIFE